MLLNSNSSDTGILPFCYSPNTTPTPTTPTRLGKFSNLRHRPNYKPSLKPRLKLKVKLLLKAKPSKLLSHIL